jgi:cell division protein FtsB
MSVDTDVATETKRAPGAPVRGRSPARPGPPRTRPAGPPRTRPASPPRARPAGPARPRASSPLQRPDAAAAGAARSSRTPFVFLVVGLLGGGLLCLLLINTILDTGAYQITQLQQQNATLAQRTQELQAQVAYEESPPVLAKQARGLGMREPGLLNFLDLKKDRIEREPTHAPGVSVWPPGYTP